MGLVDPGAVLTRFRDLPNVKIDTTVTPGRLQELIDTASSDVLLEAGLPRPPPANTPQRGSLDGLCIELVLNTLRRDLNGNKPDVLRVLLEERRDILARARSLTTKYPDRPFFTIAGASGD